MSDISKHPSDARFEAPASFAVRAAVNELAEGNLVAWVGACIGACWRGPGRPAVKWNPKNPAQFGMDVFDDLMGREGISEQDVWDAGRRAIECMVSKPMPSEAGVEAHAGNSDPAPAPD